MEKLGSVSFHSFKAFESKFIYNFLGTYRTISFRYRRLFLKNLNLKNRNKNKTELRTLLSHMKFSNSVSLCYQFKHLKTRSN